MRYKVLVSAPQMREKIFEFKKELDNNDIAIDIANVSQKLSEDQLLSTIKEYDGVIAGDDEFTSKVLKQAKNLRVISKWGVGIDSIDLAEAKNQQIKVYNTPAGFTESVADYVFAFILNLSRNLHKLDRYVRSGKWQREGGWNLHNKTIGIVGVGHIGQAVARRAHGFKMKILGNDIREVPAHILEKYQIKMIEKDDLLKHSDIVSLNCDLNPSSYHLIDMRELNIMKEGAYIINTARGPIINEKALIKALKNRDIAGAGLDVFEKEPLPEKSLLKELDNCILSPHNAYNGATEVEKIHENTVKNLIKSLKEEDDE